MKNIIHRILITALMISCIGTVDAAQTNEKSKQTKVVKTKSLKPAVQTKKGWSVKAKVIAALGVVATGIGLYLAYRKFKSAHDENKQYDALHAFEKQQQEVLKYQIPNGNAGELMQYLEAHHENFQQAMANPQGRANIENLFNDQRFIAHMEGPRGAWFRQQLVREFNQEAILNNVAQANFVDAIIAGLNQQEEMVNRRIDRF